LSQTTNVSTTVSTTVSTPLTQHHGNGNGAAETAKLAVKPQPTPAEPSAPHESEVAKQQIAAIYAEAEADHWSQARLTQALSEADAEYGSPTSLDVSA
jgi:hypothetical protein